MPINLKPHNVETYGKVTNRIEETGKAAVVHPTGTGKMFIALKLLEENKGKKAIYLAPSNSILHDVKKNIFEQGMTMEDFPFLTRMTYQKLANMSDEEIQKLDVDIIILDEFHHCGAPEWGKGVKRLIERNKNAKILGLSATPLRYLDGLRDMASELFENSVASEMTLEEAIERGLLPEATYVSALYGYEKQLDDMQDGIDKIKDDGKQMQAQILLNQLRKKLNADTYNLPEIFHKYMQTNGKYIVFCRNIEDMHEKMRQAHKMFDKVNPNIKVRAVSSQIKESDRILSEFEQDTDGGTLKLLYAVDMVNEGYHIQNLDGVVMMRPTISPTIFTQQFGRALTVGSSKKPVVLDLVNNFNSCKIIEDFAERMSQYKGNQGLGRAKEDKKSRITIFDTTKGFADIAKKIVELSSTKITTLDEKIQIFEKFNQTDEELVGSTVFEGYPIGQWAIQIRNDLNRINKGKKSTDLTKKQLEKLANLGILERRIDSTIDEKIDSLVAWRKKYPRITIVPIVPSETLCEYTETEEEQKQLIEEYERILKYYEYVRARKSRGKLSEYQIKKCKDGNIGGVFGKSNDIECQTDELVKKYDLNREAVDLIIKQYGSIDEFRKTYIDALINQNVDQVIDKKILENTTLIRGFDLSSPDWIQRDSRRRELAYDIFGREQLFVKYDGLEEDFIESILHKDFTQQEKQVLYMLYGLNGKKRETQAQIAQNIGKSRNRVFQIIAKATRKIRYYDVQSDLKNRICDIDFDLRKEIIEEYFKNFDIFVPEEPTTMDENIKIKLTNMLSEGIKKTKKRNEQVGIIERMSEEQKLHILRARFGDSIGSSDISVVDPWHKIYTCFEGGNSIDIDEKLVEDEWHNHTSIYYRECLKSEYTQSKIAEFMVKSFSDSELTSVGKKEEIEELIASNRYLSEENKEELKQLLYERIKTAAENKNFNKEEAKNLLEMTIEELDLSVRAYNRLHRAGIKNVIELMHMSNDDFRKIKGLGLKCYDEIIEKMQSLGIEMEDGCFKFAENEKEDLVKHILEQQKTIEKQCEELNSLSFQKKEGIDVY